jgi:hypothetical protein
MFTERRSAVKNVLAARNPKPVADTAAAVTETVINNQSGVLSARRFFANNHNLKLIENKGNNLLTLSL